MLKSSDITQAGFYWYWDAIGGPAQVVQVTGEVRADQAVMFPGREDSDALRDLSGEFVGPLVPPAA